MILGIGSGYVSRLDCEPVSQLPSPYPLPYGERIKVRGNRRTSEPANRLTEKGFTLIEVLLTITILAIGIMGILRAYFASLNVLEVSKYSIDAVCLLKQKMSDIEERNIEKGGLSPGEDRGEFETLYEGFKWESEIKGLVFEPDNEDSGKGLNELKLTDFNDYIEPVRKFSLVTYVESKDVSQ